MVASISAVTSAEYYLDEVDRSLYYLTGDSAGLWYGEGAAALGYEGDIVPDHFRAAFNGLTPDAARSLVQVQKKTDKQRQPAWDMTFSVPKSVSVLWSQLDAANRHKLERLVMRAAQGAIDYLDSEALTTRRGHKGQLIENARGVYALCPHGTSRAQDPQLHIHAIIFNLCLRRDGSTGTIQSHDLYLHKMAAGAVFRLGLADLLIQELGLSLVRDGWKFKIDGVSEAFCEHQSKRGKLIEKIAKESGWNSPALLSELAIATRGPKGQVSLGECFKQWTAEGKQFGFGRHEAERLIAAGELRLSREQAARSLGDSSLSNVESAIQKSVSAIAAFKSYFPERDLVSETANKLVTHGVSASQLLRAVKQSLDRFENRIEVEQSPYAFYSTRENIAIEKELLERAEKGRTSVNHVVPEHVVNVAKALVERSLSKKLGAAVSLTEDQVKALRHITLEPGDFKLVQGYAGTGKTQMLEAAHKAWTTAGFQVIGTAITGKAAVGLESATGIRAFTVESLLKQLRPHLSAKEKAELFIRKSIDAIKANYREAKRAGAWMRNPFKQALHEAIRGAAQAIGGEVSPQAAPLKLTSKSILVLDEISMLPTRPLLALKQECDKVGAKLIGVGDRLQLPPIEAGGPFWSLAKLVGHASLTTVVRQRQEWMRDAVTLMIEDQPERALELYAKHGALHFEKHPSAAIEHLVDGYSKLTSKQLGNALALTSTKEEARRINQAMQSRRKSKRELGLTSLRLPNGDRVYKHDRVMLTLNDYQLGVRNGLLGTVVQLHRTRGIMGPGSITIRLDGEPKRGFFQIKPTTITIDLKKYPDVQLGYAATTHKVQGITVEQSFVFMGDSMRSKEMAFTQLSRASHHTTLYAARTGSDSPLERLAHDISKSIAKDLAHDHKVVKQRTHGHDRGLSL